LLKKVLLTYISVVNIGDFVVKKIFCFFFLIISIFLVSGEDSIFDHIKYGEDGANGVGHIYIGSHETGISDVTWIYVQSALKHYKKTRPIFIILHLDTPGGEVFVSQRIGDALRDMDLVDGIPIVAYVDNWAISAGAMLAYSCRYIAVVPDALMGAAEPIFQGAEGIVTAPEKINSVLRADFSTRAQGFGRDPLLAEAMVDKDIILVWRNEKVVQLDDAEQINRKAPDFDVVISGEGKLLTLNAKEMEEFGVVNIQLTDHKLELITNQERLEGRWPATKELLFTDPFFEQIPNVVIDSYQMDWKMNFFSFLSHPFVMSLLFLGMIIGFYIEITTPGFGVPGAIGFVCLSFIALSSMSLEAFNWLELIVVVVGLVLLGVELFVIPGFGVIGISGIILMLGGVVLMMLPAIGSFDFTIDNGESLSLGGQYFLERLGWVTGTFILGVIIILILGRFVMPNLAILNPIVSRDDQEGTVSGIENTSLPSVGSEGIAISSMRCSGKIMIEEAVYDSISDGLFIDKGANVVVVRIESGRPVVKERK
jgi:membrane-bound serine protease (ClpP class)